MSGRAGCLALLPKAAGLLGECNFCMLADPTGFWAHRCRIDPRVNGQKQLIGLEPFNELRLFWGLPPGTLSKPRPTKRLSRDLKCNFYQLARSQKACSATKGFQLIEAFWGAPSRDFVQAQAYQRIVQAIKVLPGLCPSPGLPKDCAGN